jgi:hypothetical protein
VAKLINPLECELKVINNKWLTKVIGKSLDTGYDAADAESDGLTAENFRKAIDEWREKHDDFHRKPEPEAIVDLDAARKLANDFISLTDKQRKEAESSLLEEGNLALIEALRRNDPCTYDKLRLALRRDLKRAIDNAVERINTARNNKKEALTEMKLQALNSCILSKWVDLSDDLLCGDGVEGEHEGELNSSGEHEREFNPSYPYLVRDGVIHAIKRTKEGEVEYPLCNFSARIVEEIVRDGGAESTCHFLIEGEIGHHGSRLPAAEVASSNFASLNWVTANWGNLAIVYAGQSSKDHLRCAIQLLSREFNRRTVYGHMGWRKVNDEWRYLHAGGALGVDENREDIEVDLGRNNMVHYRLPDPVDGEILHRAIRESLKLVSVYNDPEVGYGYLAMIYRVPTAEMCMVDTSGFHGGKTGTHKSEVSALAQQHFGTDFGSHAFPASWEDTDTDLEIKASGAKDAVFVIDDFKPKGSANDIARLHSKADRVFRGAANKSGRGRRTSTLQARPTYFPRGLIIATGEDIPKWGSLRGRLCILESRPDDTNLDVLTQLQAAGREGVLALAMAGYIQWLAPQVEVLKETLRPRIEVLRNECASALSKDAHARHPTTYAHLAVGLELLFRFARECGALDAHEAQRQLQEGLEHLQRLIMGQAVYVEEEDEVNRFFALLRAALSSDRCHLNDLDTQGLPSNPQAWGWSQHPDKFGNREWQPQGERIGWVGSDKAYLIPDATYAAIQQLARDQQDTLAISQRTLWKRLADRGALAVRDPQRNTARKFIAGRNEYVVCIFSEHLNMGASGMQLNKSDKSDKNGSQANTGAGVGVDGQFGNWTNLPSRREFVQSDQDPGQTQTLEPIRPGGVDLSDLSDLSSNILEAPQLSRTKIIQSHTPALQHKTGSGVGSLKPAPDKADDLFPTHSSGDRLSIPNHAEALTEHSDRHDVGASLGSGTPLGGAGLPYVCCCECAFLRGRRCGTNSPWSGQALDPSAPRVCSSH